MGYVVVFVKGFYEHVIDVHFHSLSELFGEHSIDKSLVSSTRILETERHYLVAIRSTVGDECGLLAIVGIHHDLIVPGEGVHE